MEPLRQIREILKAWREKVDVLPAVGGALEDMLHPDAEEQEERTFTDERIFDTIWERAEGGEKVNLYHPTPPIARTQTHLFRYFLDGSLRSYFLAQFWRATATPQSTTPKLALVFSSAEMTGQFSESTLRFGTFCLLANKGSLKKRGSSLKTFAKTRQRSWKIWLHPMSSVGLTAMQICEFVQVAKPATRCANLKRN